jgi:hypothetical protein
VPVYANIRDGEVIRVDLHNLKDRLDKAYSPVVSIEQWLFAPQTGLLVTNDERKLIIEDVQNFQPIRRKGGDS